MDNAPSTLATFILPIAKALRLQGVDPMELLEAADIDPSHVINADRRIDVPRMQRFWRLAVETTNDENFGLHAADQLQPATLQGLGLAVLASDTLYDALKRLVRFSQVLSTGLLISLEEEGEFVEIVYHYSIADFGDDFTWPVLDFSVGVILVMCRLTLGEYVSPFCVETQRPAPADPDQFESLLGSRHSLFK